LAKYPVGHEATQILVVVSRYLVPLQDVQFVAVTVHVAQFELHGLHKFEASIA
jgi:hypothetical protein